MKRAASILMASMMTLLIVWLGSGVSILQCMHTGSVSVVGLGAPTVDEQCLSDVAEQNEETSCCSSATDTDDDGDGCMAVHTLRLAPSTSASPISFDFHQLPIFVCPSIGTTMVAWCFNVYYTNQERTPYVWHSPPRRYLSFIRKLQI